MGVTVQSEILKRYYNTNWIIIIPRITIRVNIFGFWCRTTTTRVCISGFWNWVGFWNRIRIQIWRNHFGRWVMVGWFGNGRLTKDSFTLNTTFCTDSFCSFYYYLFFQKVVTSISWIWVVRFGIFLMVNFYLSLQP